MIMRETEARLIGYGAMLMESFVGVMAMVQPARFRRASILLSIANGNRRATTSTAAQTISSWATRLPADHDRSGPYVGEQTLLNRAGARRRLLWAWRRFLAAPLAGPHLMAVWYHFAIMFERFSF